jgi:hypothetical protein
MRKRRSHWWKPRQNRTSEQSSRTVTCRRGDCPRAQTRATCHTRLLHPDELTQPEYQMTRPTCQSWMSMTSSWPVGMPCQRPVTWHVNTVGPTCHVISLEPSWAEPFVSRAKPRAYREDSVQRSLRATRSEIESGPLIRPELFWSNLNCLKCDLDDFRLVSS